MVLLAGFPFPFPGEEGSGVLHAAFAHRETFTLLHVLPLVRLPITITKGGTLTHIQTHTHTHTHTVVVAVVTFLTYNWAMDVAAMVFVALFLRFYSTPAAQILCARRVEMQQLLQQCVLHFFAILLPLVFRRLYPCPPPQGWCTIIAFAKFVLALLPGCASARTGFCINNRAVVRNCIIDHSASSAATAAAAAARHTSSSIPPNNQQQTASAKWHSR